MMVRIGGRHIATLGSQPVFDGCISVLSQLLREPLEYLEGGLHVSQGAVGLFVLDIKGGTDRTQLVVGEAIPVAGKLYRVADRPLGEVFSSQAEFDMKETEIEGGVVRHQHPVFQELPDPGQDVDEEGSILEIFIVDIVDLAGLLGNPPTRLNQGLVGFLHLAANAGEDSDLYNPVAAIGVDSRGFKIKNRDGGIGKSCFYQGAVHVLFRRWSAWSQRAGLRLQW